MPSNYRYGSAYILNIDTGRIEDVNVTVSITDNAGDNTYQSGGSDGDQGFTLTGSSVNGTYTAENNAGTATITSGGTTLTGVYGVFRVGGTVFGTDYAFFIPESGTGTFTDGSSWSSSNVTSSGFGYSDVTAQGNDTVTLDDQDGRLVQGGAGNDNITGSQQADTLSGGSGSDTISGRGGNDNITGSEQADTLYGGTGADTISGGGGNDVIYGDSDAAPRLAFQWSELPAEDPLADSDEIGFATQDVGGITVSLDYDEEANGRDVTFQTSAQYTTGIDTGGTGAVDGNSSGQLYGTRSGADPNTSVLTVNFSSNTSEYQDTVSNVQFRINDIDQNGTNGFRDRVTVRAYDAEGKRIAVTLQSGGGGTAGPTLSDRVEGAGEEAYTGVDTALGNAATANNDAAGSIKVTVNGPVAWIEVDYENAGTSNQAITITDIYFTPIQVPVTGAGDSIDGGAGNDAIYGQLGNDTIRGGDGADSIEGGAGNDTLRGDAGNDTILGGAGNDTLDGGAGTDTLTGGDGFDTFVADGTDDLISDFNTATGQNIDDGNQANNDFVDLSSFYNSGTLAAYNSANGTDFTQAIIALRDDAADGVLDFAGGLRLPGVSPEDLTFDNTNVICFTPGTSIVTATGARPVETLQIGDLVATRDHGLRPLVWVGRRELTKAEVEQKPQLAPVLIRRGALGPDSPNRDMIVSPQHRILLKGKKLALMTGEAEALAPAIGLVNGDTIVSCAPQAVTYLHLMCRNHEVIRADGVWTETLFPGDQALSGLTAEARAEVCELFPDLTGFVPARTLIASSETRWLSAV